LTLRAGLWTFVARMVWWLYNIIFAIGFLLMLPRFLVRMARRGGYLRDFQQRFGRYGASVEARLGEGPRIWVHAVSVGEVYVALKLMADWRARGPGSASFSAPPPPRGTASPSDCWTRPMC
jgi:3-deoxy-D-manno-octulosonic-acid transferase